MKRVIVGLLIAIVMLAGIARVQAEEKGSCACAPCSCAPCECK